MLKLIWNDIKVLKASILVILVYIIIFAIGVISMNSFSTSIGTLAVYLMVGSIMGVEERDGINLMHRCMPIKISQIVGAKYLEILLTVLIFVLSSFIIHTCISPSQISLTMLMSVISMSLIFASVSIPIMYKFGVIKSKIPVMIIWLGGLMFISTMQISGLITLSNWVIPPAAVILFAASWMLSIQIYKNKDI